MFCLYLVLELTTSATFHCLHWHFVLCGPRSELRFDGQLRYHALLPLAATDRFKFFYASRIPLQCTLILTQLSQGLLWIHLYGKDRNPWVFSCLLLISILGLLSIVMVACPPFTEVSTCAHCPTHNTNICARIETYRGAVVTAAMISNEISIMLVPLCFSGLAVMSRKGRAFAIA